MWITPHTNIMIITFVRHGMGSYSYTANVEFLAKQKELLKLLGRHRGPSASLR